MTKTEFDYIAEQYEDMLRQNIGIYGRDTTYYAEHKAIIISQNTSINPIRILEFGCGTGRNIRFLQKYFPEASIVGYDVSLESLAIAKRTNPGVQFVSNDKLEEYANTFDIILIANVFHHIPAQKQISTMQIAKSLLRPDGEMFIVEHNPYNFMTVHAVDTCVFDENAVLIALNAMKDLIRAAGLEILNQGYTLFFPTSIRFLQPVERYLAWLPFGAQYFIRAQRKDS
ncbi:MAG: class I SAM-dependent methyltransferase [Anaerolineae bacterium]|nr:class I SAM-dependent methyltransferase [Anaerolineae bacterium]